MKNFCVTKCLIGHFGDYEDDLTKHCYKQFESKLYSLVKACIVALAPSRAPSTM